MAKITIDDDEYYIINKSDVDKYLEPLGFKQTLLQLIGIIYMKKVIK